VFPGVGRDAEYIADQVATRAKSHERGVEQVLDAA